MIKKFALLVGVDEYPFLGDLKCARNDAQAFGEAIQKYWGFGSDEVVTMTDVAPGVLNATHDYILDQLDVAREKGDLTYFIFGFWGHGFLAQDGSNRYLCLSSTTESRLASSSLSFGALFDDVTKIGALNTLIVADCCQTLTSRGESNMTTAAEESALAGYAAATARNVQAKRREKNFALDVDPTVAILNACSRGQLSYEFPNGKHGFFTDAVLQTMGELAAQRNGSVGDLARLVNRRVKEVAQRHGKIQSPYSKFEGAGAFSFPIDGSIASASSADASLVPPPPKETFSEALQKARSALNEKVDANSPDPLEQIRVALNRAYLALKSARALFDPSDIRGKILYNRLVVCYREAIGRLDKVEQGWKVYSEGNKEAAACLVKEVLAEDPAHVAALELKTIVDGELEEERRQEVHEEELEEEQRQKIDAFTKEVETLLEELTEERPQEAASGFNTTPNKQFSFKIEGVRRSNIEDDLTPGKQLSLKIEDDDYLFSFIPKGTFLMGSPTYEMRRSLDEVQHKVILREDFWLASYPVTQKLYQTIMGNNPSCFKGEKYPVEKVSWNDCVTLIKRLNAAGYAPNGWQFSLPTEAQWEYACRAGTTTPFSFGTSLNGDKANCNGKYPYCTIEGEYMKRTTIVGRYPCNPWGLYDMHGNVWEWCLDCYSNYPVGMVTDPCKTTGANHVLRGGGWNSDADNCRSAYRLLDKPIARHKGYGFRLALVRWQRNIKRIDFTQAGSIFPASLFD